MLSLILFRHGKSDWEAGASNDHDRPLNDRGRAAAHRMGQLLSDIDKVPDLAVSSSARRARDSLTIASRAGRWKSSIRIASELYNTSPNEMLHWLAALDHDPQRLLLTGHEPTWSGLAGLLIGGTSIHMPTAAMLRIDFPFEHWADIGPGKGELHWLITPKVAARLRA